MNLVELILPLSAPSLQGIPQCDKCKAHHLESVTCLEYARSLQGSRPTKDGKT